MAPQPGLVTNQALVDLADVASRQHVDRIAARYRQAVGEEVEAGPAAAPRPPDPLTAPHDVIAVRTTLSTSVLLRKDNWRFALAATSAMPPPRNKAAVALR